ncbi:class I mannose-6-phosphate isomerase [Ruminococcaceae bacterium OttesenSCG-928-A16]|nr:class I mannose-6-phosphate isomerase [Ruminococcaceae bacterium OttesenSCG-928-A16]
MASSAEAPLVLKLMETRVWRTYHGGRRLNTWHGRPAGEDSEYPEDWIASAVKTGREIAPEEEGFGREEGLSYVLTPQGTPLGSPQQTLYALLKQQPEILLGKAHQGQYGSSMAVLIKLIDAAERLSIQVHPDQTYAKEVLHSPFGKTEAWLILSDQGLHGKKPYIYLGFKPGITREVWKDLFDRQDIDGMLGAMHRVEVSKGDVFIVKGGVPHAIGAGCFLLEIQEPTDLTMRTERTTVSGSPIADRLCHQGVGFEKMLDCFHYEGLPLQEVLQRWKLAPKVKKAGDNEVSTLIDDFATTLFGMREVTVGNRWAGTREGGFSVGIVTQGKGILRWEGGECLVQKGEYLFFAAALKKIEIICDTGQEAFKMIECFPPKIYQGNTA